MFTERTSVGLDVHARSVAAAAIDGVTGELVQAKLTPSHQHIRSWIRELSGPVAATYEAHAAPPEFERSNRWVRRVDGANGTLRFPSVHRASRRDAAAVGGRARERC